MKNLLTLFFGVLLVSSFGTADAQNIWSLQKCIDYAIENNIQIKQQELGTEYGENQVKQAKSDKLPNLNGNISNEYSFGRNLVYPENTYQNTNSASVSAVALCATNFSRGLSPSGQSIILINYPNACMTACRIIYHSNGKRPDSQEMASIRIDES